MRLLPAAAAAAVALGAIAALAGPALRSEEPAREAASVTVSVDRSQVWRRSRLRVGVTHTQYSLDPWGDPAAVSRGKRLLRGAASLQNQAIYGWGARNPNPAPGVYDWRSLDRRIQLIRSMRARPVITLCCTPDWMTARGTRTSSYPNEPPTQDHYDDFAALAQRIAQRYPDVRDYVVWNEMKGFWDGSAGNWEYAGYTLMYNQVWTALKSVDQRIRVGGPYLVIEGAGSRALGKRGWAAAPPITGRNWRVIRHWLREKRGADFLAIDRKTVSSSHDRNRYTRPEYLQLTRWFGAVVRQLRRATRLPIWFVEDYFTGSRSWRFQAVGLASMLYNHVRSGAAVTLRWAPQGKRGGSFGGNNQNLFSDTRVSGGGRPFPAYAVYRTFARHFRPGTALFRTRSTSPWVEALASARHTMLINKRRSAVRVRLKGVGAIHVPGYGVRVVP